MDMSSEHLGEILEGDSADMCAHADLGPSGGSEDPHRRELKFVFVFNLIA